MVDVNNSSSSSSHTGASKPVIDLAPAIA